jgi:dienelactone hydrolase
LGESVRLAHGLAACAAFFAFAAAAAPLTLSAARTAHPMEIALQTRDGTPPPAPPARVLRLVHYPSPAGTMAAYLTPPAGGGRHSAIVWITGGDCNSISDVWTPMPADNDQTAAAFRAAGIVTMYPALRGGNDNPGFRELFYGEVDDILAAADWLAQQPDVDPQRIYLGGHSTGGTLALLTAERSPRFRATFVFGPVRDIRGYGRLLPAPLGDETQARLRSPGYWLDSIASPVFAFEGDHRANTGELRSFATLNHNPQAHFQLVPGADHFSILAPATALVARKILADRGGTPDIAFGDEELAALLH